MSADIFRPGSSLQATHVSKMDAVSREYTHLLSSQLESQRQYYEELRTQDETRSAAELATVQEQLAMRQTQMEAAQQQVEKASSQLQSAYKQFQSSAAKAKESKKEVEVLTELNKGLIANQQVFKDKLAASEGKCKELHATVQDLKEQVRDLMVYLEASQMAGNNNEMAGGSVHVAEEKKKSRNRRR